MIKLNLLYKLFLKNYSFCQQVDDWMLLEITEKIVRENAFEQKERESWVKFNPGLSANPPSNNWAQFYRFGYGKMQFVHPVNQFDTPMCLSFRAGLNCSMTNHVTHLVT